MAQKSVIVGTAGHIDHGKTALVKALTGIDADRLAEEKRRGITIDLGFAHMESEGVRFGFVDVPGHEKFVRNMLAGIGGIDMVLLVIAADEGVKPQTREHLNICKLLGIKHGIVALSKSDKVDAARLAAVRAEVASLVRGSFLETAEAVAVSAQSGDGVDGLKQEMTRVAGAASVRATDGLLRLPVDRVFTMTGFGTVVTGTMVSGRVKVGDEVEVLPGGCPFRVRGIQVHNRAADAALAGERAAVNLAGAQKAEMTRGMTLTVPGTVRVTSLIDAQVSLFDIATKMKSDTRFHFHNLSAEAVVTLQRYDASTGFARLRLTVPMLLLPGDRFILRRFSPVTTVGGGEVLDAAPMKVTSDAFLSVMSQGDAKEKLLARVERRGTNGLALREAQFETGWQQTTILQLLNQCVQEGKIVQSGDVMVTTEHFQSAAKHVLEAVSRFHESEPLAAGANREDVRASARLSPAVFPEVVAQLVREKRLQESGDSLQAAGRSVVLKDDEKDARKKIEDAFKSAGLNVPAMRAVLSGLAVDQARAHKIVTLLLRDKILVRLGDDLVFHSAALSALRTMVRDYKSKSTTIDVAQFKDMTQVSRKYAIPLLEFLDRERVTRRQGDVRVIL